MSEQENVQDTQTPIAAPIAATTPTPTSTPSTPQTETPSASVPSTPEEWKPDFGKLKVMDKEFEWDEDIKKVVTKDNYDRLKELHNKAYGLPFVKDRYTSTKEELKTMKQQIESEYLPLKQDVDFLNNVITKKDLPTLFKVLNLTDQEVMKYALDRANYYNLPHEQRADYDQNIQARQSATFLEQQNAFLQQQLQQQTTVAREQQLNVYTSNPEVAPIAKMFDEKVGRAGAFRDEVIKRGQLAWHTQKVDLPVEQAVGEVLSLVKPFLAQGQNTIETPMQTAQMPQQAPQMSTQKPVIPNVKANAQSPAKKVYKSTEELRKLASTMEA